MKKGIIVILWIIVLSILFTAFLSSNPVSYIANRYLVNLDFTHDKVHKGDLWSISDYKVMPATSNSTYVFYTGDKDIHMIFQFKNKYEAEFIFCENSTIIDNGSLMTYYNRNRNFVGGDGVTAYINAELGDCNVQYSRTRLGDGRFTGGSDRAVNEYILRSNTTYAIYVENIAVQTNVINHYFEWYEEWQN